MTNYDTNLIIKQNWNRNKPKWFVAYNLPLKNLPCPSKMFKDEQAQLTAFVNSMNNEFYEFILGY